MIVFAAVFVGLVAWAALVVCVLALCRAAGRAEDAYEQLDPVQAPPSSTVAIGNTPVPPAVAHR